MPQSLCHGMSRMPSVTPIGLNNASMRLCARLLRYVWPACRDRADRARTVRRREARRRTLGVIASKPCMRTRRVVAVGGARPPRLRRRLFVGRHRAVHVGRDRVHLVFGEQPADVQEARRLEEVAASRRDRRRAGTSGARSSGLPSTSLNDTEPGVYIGVPSSAARSTSHQSHEMTGLPPDWSSVLPAHRLMIVAWSFTRSASCCCVNARTRHLVSSAPSRDRTRPSSARSVHDVSVDVDDERSGRDEREPGDARRVGVERGGEVVGRRIGRGRSSGPSASTRVRMSTVMRKRVAPGRRLCARSGALGPVLRGSPRSGCRTPRR